MRKQLYALLAALFIITASKNIQAQTTTPDVANFTVTVHSGNNVSFTNTSVIGNVPGTRYARWFFGDGTSQASPALGHMQHHYNAAGTYNVCLKIYRYSNTSNDSVLTAQFCRTVTVENLCNADFQFRDSIIPGTNNTHLVSFLAIAQH